MPLPRRQLEDMGTSGKLGNLANISTMAHFFFLSFLRRPRRRAFFNNDILDILIHQMMPKNMKMDLAASWMPFDAYFINAAPLFFFYCGPVHRHTAMLFPSILAFRSYVCEKCHTNWPATWGLLLETVRPLRFISRWLYFQAFQTLTSLETSIQNLFFQFANPSQFRSFILFYFSIQFETTLKLWIVDSSTKISNQLDAALTCKNHVF